MITMVFVVSAVAEAFCSQLFCKYLSIKCRMSAWGRGRDGGTNITFIGEGEGSEKGELELHRCPASDGRRGEKREGIHRE